MVRLNASTAVSSKPPYLPNSPFLNGEKAYSPQVLKQDFAHPERVHFTFTEAIVKDAIPERLQKYRRQIAFAPLGRTGQEKLLQARVLVCGCGALGALLADILARAGVGFLRLVDFDVVERHNLHRQFLFTERDAEEKRYKVDAAAEKIRAGNSDVKLEPICDRLTHENAGKLFQEIDLVLDGTDNFRTRFVLNETAVRYKIPFVSAGVLASRGQVFSVIPGRTPCLACLISEHTRNDQELDESGMEEHGILGPAVVMAAALEAAEAIKLLAALPECVNESLFAFDLWKNRYVNLDATSLRAGHCEVCGFS